MTEWQDIDQSPVRSPPPPRPTVRLALAGFGRRGGPSCVALTVRPKVAAQLGWTLGQKVGLAVGQGRTFGWLRIAPHPLGRPLHSRPYSKKDGRPSDDLVAKLAAPPEWRHLSAPGTGADYVVQGDALLVEIPFDFSDITPAEETAA